MSLPQIVTLEEAKDHCRITGDYEDALLESYIDTATETALAHADGLSEDVTDYPASLKTAILMHVARLFDVREDGATPRSSISLANRYRKWGV